MEYLGVSRDGKAQKQAPNYTKPNNYVRNPAWSPRGAQIVCEYAETTGNIWVMEINRIGGAPGADA